MLDLLRSCDSNYNDAYTSENQHSEFWKKLVHANCETIYANKRFIDWNRRDFDKKNKIDENWKIFEKKTPFKCVEKIFDDDNSNMNEKSLNFEYDIDININVDLYSIQS